MSKCKYCKSQQTNVLEDSELIEYKGSKLNVYVVYSECANCKREFLSKKQILNNEARIRDAKKQPIKENIMREIMKYIKIVSQEIQSPVVVTMKWNSIVDLELGDYLIDGVKYVLESAEYSRPAPWVTPSAAPSVGETTATFRKK